MTIQKNISFFQHRRILWIVMMSVRSEDGAPVNFKEAVVGKNREFQYHLVYFGVAVAAHAENLIFPRKGGGINMAMTSFGL